MSVSIRAVAVPRAGSGPSSPIYHITVSALVPATVAVAVVNVGPTTRWGGLPKKSTPAATAEAAVNEVSASLPIALVSAVCRLAAVAAGVVPMTNWLGPGDVALVAVSDTVSFVPSGKLSSKLIASPLFGLAVKSTEAAGGEPAGPVRVAPVIVVETFASLKP